MIRAHAGRRHARAVPVAPRKTIRAILRDAFVTSTTGALIGGLGLWAAMQWAEVFNGVIAGPVSSLIIFVP